MCSRVMKGIRSLLNNILNADRFDEQVDAIKSLESGVEQYANQSVIEELESLIENNLDSSFYIKKRIEELKDQRSLKQEN